MGKGMDLSTGAAAAEEVEVELCLGLSTGGRNNNVKKAALATPGVVAERSVNLEVQSGKLPAVTHQMNGRDAMDAQRRKKMHALQRKIARRKREEKQQRKWICWGTNGFQSPAVVATAAAAASGTGENDHQPSLNIENNPNPDANHRSSSNTTPSVDPNANLNHSFTPYGPFPVMPMQYPYMMPFANGFGYHYMMPLWNSPVPSMVPDGSAPQRNVFQPVASRSFRPVGCDGADSVKDGEMNGGSIRRANSLTASQGSSFSAISDYHCGSQQGGSSSSDTRSNSKQEPPPKENPEPNLSSLPSNNIHGQLDPTDVSPVQEEPLTRVDEEEEPADKQLTSNITPPSEETKIPTSIINTVAAETNPEVELKSTMPTTNKHEPAVDQAKLVQDQALAGVMPCVSTTGNGPNGKKITGYLYRYSKTEISIMCLCHGTSFSPAEFIKHAGGTDVSHPLRHIVMVPSQVHTDSSSHSLLGQ